MPRVAADLAGTLGFGFRSANAVLRDDPSALSAGARFFASLVGTSGEPREDREASMSDEPLDRVARRTFLNRMALTAGAARLSPALLAAAPLGPVSAEAAETSAPAKGESGYTPKLAAYAAA